MAYNRSAPLNPASWSRGVRAAYAIGSVIWGVFITLLGMKIFALQTRTMTILWLGAMGLVTAGNLGIAAGVFFAKNLDDTPKPAEMSKEDSRRLSQYRRFYDAGYITKAELKAKRAEILRDI